DRRLVECFLIPHGANRESRLIHPRRVRYDAIEVFGKTLRLNQTLPSSIRTGVPIGMCDWLTVVVLRDVLRRGGREMHRAVGVVDRFLWIAQYERRARFLPCVVARVRLRECKAELQGCIALRDAAGVI